MPEFNNPTTTLPYVEKGDRIMGGSPSEFANWLSEDFFSRSLTYTQLNTLVTNSTLIPAMWYKITNATTANFNLLVQAIAVNKIGCDAKDPLYPNDVVKYNFASNVITWRWDTVNDISAGEDWRNSNNISIGTGCSHIEIGANCVISIGNNCSNIKLGNNVGVNDDFIGNGCENIEIGNDATIKIFAGSYSIKAKDNISLILLAQCNNIILENNCSLQTIANKSLDGITMINGSLSATDNISNLVCYIGADISASTNIYNITQQKTIQGGNSNLPRLIYLDNSNNLVNVDAEA